MKIIVSALIGFILGCLTILILTNRYEYRSTMGLPIVRVDRWKAIPEIRRGGVWEELQGASKKKAALVQENEPAAFDPDKYLRETTNSVDSK